MCLIDWDIRFWYYKRDKRQLTAKDKKEYKKFLKEYDNYKKLYNKKNHQNLNEIRTVIEKHKDTAKIYISIKIIVFI